MIPFLAVSFTDRSSRGSLKLARLHARGCIGRRRCALIWFVHGLPPAPVGLAQPLSQEKAGPHVGCWPFSDAAQYPTLIPNARLSGPWGLLSVAGSNSIAIAPPWRDQGLTAPDEVCRICVRDGTPDGRNRMQLPVHDGPAPEADAKCVRSNCPENGY
jgi:hypothetical protein